MFLLSMDLHSALLQFVQYVSVSLLSLSASSTAGIEEAVGSFVKRPGCLLNRKKVQ
jgi:hypothetical protein